MKISSLQLDKEILSECESLYKNLYSSNNSSQNERADNGEKIKPDRTG